MRKKKAIELTNDEVDDCLDLLAKLKETGVANMFLSKHSISCLLRGAARPGRKMYARVKEAINAMDDIRR